MNNKIYSEYEISNWPFQVVDLIATYEELFKVPEQEQVTVYFGDYGSHFFKSPSQGATPEHVSDVFNKSLNAIGMSSEEFLSNKGKFIGRGKIIELMRSMMPESSALAQTHSKPSLDESIKTAKDISSKRNNDSIQQPNTVDMDR